MNTKLVKLLTILVLLQSLAICKIMYDNYWQDRYIAQSLMQGDVLYFMMKYHIQGQHDGEGDYDGQLDSNDYSDADTVGWHEECDRRSDSVCDGSGGDVDEVCLNDGEGRGEDSKTLER